MPTATPPFTLAAATGALSVGVGFLPVIGAERGLGPLITGAMVPLLAAAAALLQPRVGRAHDDGRIGDRTGMAGGLVVTALGCAAVLISGVAGLLTAAVLIGVGVGLITPIGFANLAKTSQKERLGQTMGSAQVGRELGDAGGPRQLSAPSLPRCAHPRARPSADCSPPPPDSSPPRDAQYRSPPPRIQPHDRHPADPGTGPAGPDGARAEAAASRSQWVSVAAG